MRSRVVSRSSMILVLAIGMPLAVLPAWAVVPRQEPARFDQLARSRPGGVVGVRAVRTSQLDPSDPLRQGWDQFQAQQGDGWTVWVDDRSGLPSLVIGGIAWLPGPGNDLSQGSEPGLEGLEELARRFLEDHPILLGSWKDQLSLDLEASGPIGNHVWQVTFRQVLKGVPVEGARYDFQVSQGNLVSFGATGWAKVSTSPEPSLSSEEARVELNEYLGLDGSGDVTDLEEGSLHLIPVDPLGMDGAAWKGARGQGYSHILVWRFVFSVPGEPATWVGEVDAHTGDIVSLFDDTRYERVKGGILPNSNDGNCANDGCEVGDFPLPFADFTEDGGPVQFTGDHGLYQCAAIGAFIETNLDGQYVRVNDNCGAVSEIIACEEELDLGVNPGPDCQVAAGASPGNTRASRTSFYHLNLVKQKGRAWLPSNTWLQGVLTDNVNINSNCNAFWNGTVNFYTSGGSCNNTGTNQGVIVHEWGHGIDQNDGGGYDNPSEAYGDIVAFFENHESCIGRGFRVSANCGGYGDTCLDCTGIRDMDWDKRTLHTPATPSGFLTNNCPGGSGPCGKETHCEGYVSGEALWDLATRDLPALGLDQDTSWQLAEKLWYLSRDGSGGNAYNCSLPSSDGCGTNSWFHKLRLIDDDDGNLDNGTPHAEAIFDAFDRHDIACGMAGNSSNQNSSSCPTLQKPVLTNVDGLTNKVELTWDPVTNAASYTILRNELGCDRSQIIIGTVSDPTTTFTDDDVSNDSTLYYRIQAVGSNNACDSPVSDCSTVTTQRLAGKVRFDQAAYGCSHRIGIAVLDANAGSSTVNVTVQSDTESVAEPVVLTETAPGSGKFVGDIFTTTDSPASDGLLSITDGDAITVEYIDADDGEGGVSLTRQHQAAADCSTPIISNLQDQGTTDTSATITWTTDEIADTVLIWGEITPPGQTETGATRATSHEIQLTGLQECTEYFYEAQSTDPAGNTAADDNGGSFHRFETLGDFGDGLQNCHAGLVTVNAPVHSCSDTVTFRVVDLDLNEDPLVAEPAILLVTSTTETEPEIVIATETGPNTSKFAGSITTSSGSPTPDGVLQTSGGDLLTVSYEDADDGAGAAMVSFDTATLDCGGPKITNLRVEVITNARGSVRWNTEEPADTVVEWGDTPALGQTSSSGTLVTAHDMVLNQFDTCQEAYFRVRSTDGFGNTTLVDNGGSPFLFSTYQIPGLYWMDDFESGSIGWNLEGEWEIGQPQGLGGSSGGPDPSEAYNNSGVLGHDLSGQGSFGGDYEPGILESAESPAQNASTWTNTKLLFSRRLNTGADDVASLFLWANGIGAPFFTSSGTVLDSDYQLFSFDLGSFFDGKFSVFVEFRQQSDISGQFSGWNVDDVILKDGSLPDFAACGGCATAPSFAGAASASDNDACGATGVTVFWEPAVSFGSGGDGTFAIYQDSSPNFTPSPSNLVASGVTGLSYNDTTAPNDLTLHYIVRAENDETCSGGPNNGGVTDGNNASVQVEETTSQPIPTKIETLTALRVGGAHVTLEWEAVAAATSYRIYRSTSPQPETFSLLAETSDLFYEDIGAGASPDTFFYKLTAVNACGEEGPC